ncbi:hypothetical protein DFH28DRAFT_186992 [Melampsora americana]|nr:hypothetical protein DFH28DRAFT_186992 [Melampsora americana]
MRRSNLVFTIAALSGSASAWVKDIDINNPPYKADPGSWGYNQCGTKASPDSKCQNMYLRSSEDFCLFGPHDLSGVSETEREAVSYCTKDGHGTRLIPPGTFESVHFVHTPHYVQITGRGNFTKINVKAGDDGGELDAAGYDARGNPIGGIVFGRNNQFEHWTEFLLPDEFCVRACFKGPDDWRYCNHIYDIMACRWNIPGDYSPGFDDCEGEDVPHPMGEYVQPDGKIKIWKQGDQPTPPPGAPGKLKSCRRTSSPGSLYDGQTPNTTAPTQNSTMPGENGTMPGQNDTMPGQNDTMPGQNNTGSSNGTVDYPTNSSGWGTPDQNNTTDDNYPTGSSGFDPNNQTAPDTLDYPTNSSGWGTPDQNNTTDDNYPTGSSGSDPDHQTAPGTVDDPTNSSGWVTPDQNNTTDDDYPTGSSGSDPNHQTSPGTVDDPTNSSGWVTPDQNNPSGGSNDNYPTGSSGSDPKSLRDTSSSDNYPTQSSDNEGSSSTENQVMSSTGDPSNNLDLFKMGSISKEMKSGIQKMVNEFNQEVTYPGMDRSLLPTDSPLIKKVESDPQSFTTQGSSTNLLKNPSDSTDPNLNSSSTNDDGHKPEGVDEDEDEEEGECYPSEE